MSIELTQPPARVPAPHIQFEVEAAGRIRRLDLAYPKVKLAIEYDGRDHRDQERAHRDLLREAALVELGWTILRFDARTVYLHPAQVARRWRTNFAAGPTLVHSAP
jgi:very-short-patch-repair endonuclease